MTTIKRVKKTQKIRVLSGDVCFYTTADQIRKGVGDSYAFNAATQKALDSLEFTSVQGISGVWEGAAVQLNLI